MKKIFLLIVAVFIYSQDYAQRSREFRTLRAFEEKGIIYQIPIITQREFDRMARSNPLIPTTERELAILFNALYNPGARPVNEIRLSRNKVIPLDLDCSTEPYSLLWEGMQNPRAERFLADYDYQSGSLAYTIDFSPSPGSKLDSIVTDHFVHKFFPDISPAQNVGAADTINANIVMDIAIDLETSWNKYFQKFNKTPYLVSGTDKIDILYTGAFISSGSNGYTHPGYSCIVLNAKQMRDPGVFMKRVSVPAHELFHRMQYQYGYRTQPNHEQKKYFSEGTASWAEIDTWNSVSFLNKLTYHSANPNKPLTDYSYGSASFWNSLTNRGGDMKYFMEQYESGGNILNALEATSQQAIPGSFYGNTGGMLKLWHRSHITYEFNPLNVQLADGSTFSNPFNMKRKFVRMQDQTSIPGEIIYTSYYKLDTVKEYASKYYQFRLPIQWHSTYDNYDSIKFTVSTPGTETVDIQYVLAEVNNGFPAWKKAIAPFKAESYQHTFAIPDPLFSSYYDIWVIIEGNTSGAIFEITADLTPTSGGGSSARVATIDPEELEEERKVLNHAYPNPFVDKTTIDYEFKSGETGQLIITDLAGGIVKQMPLDADQQQVEIKNLGTPGIYFYRIVGKEREYQRGKLIYKMR